MGHERNERRTKSKFPLLSSTISLPVLYIRDPTLFPSVEAPPPSLNQSKMSGAMANGLCATLLLIMFILPWCHAADYTVGDTSGWTTDLDYSTWTSGKNFAVGDTLKFNYSTTLHNVLEVTSGGYGSCSTANPIYTDRSGSTTITLNTPGTRYFICGVPGHCDRGMKLAVTVAGATPSPPFTPSPPSSCGSLVPTATVILAGLALLQRAVF
uniref:Blue copper protein n=1 Tax=Anthurium amnicola TaxID=1678845 RepID=A0A1D1YFS1_9ARAE